MLLSHKSRLIDLDRCVVRRELPFGAEPRSAKRSAFRIADPLLDFWFTFVESNRSRLAARREAGVSREVAARMPGHAAGVWEERVRESVPLAAGREVHLAIWSQQQLAHGHPRNLYYFRDQQVSNWTSWFRRAMANFCCSRPSRRARSCLPPRAPLGDSGALRGLTTSRAGWSTAEPQWAPTWKR